MDPFNESGEDEDLVDPFNEAYQQEIIQRNEAINKKVQFRGI